MTPAVDPWLPAPMRVLSTLRESDDVVTLTLDASERPLPFAPGQFNMLYLFGKGEVAISISGDPAAPDRLVHTIRGVGAVTRPMIAVDPGTVLGVRGPFGAPWPVAEAAGRDLIFVAGGLGLAPLRPAILYALRRRDDYGRIAILYGARAPRDMLYVDQLRRWRGRFDVDVAATVDRPDPGWRGPVGAVTRLLQRASFDPDDAAVFTCGPEIMMRFVAVEAIKQGAPAEQIWLSMERNMHCAVGICGRCQWGAAFVCKDGPVFRFDRVADALHVREL